MYMQAYANTHTQTFRMAHRKPRIGGRAAGWLLFGGGSQCVLIDDCIDVLPQRSAPAHTI